MSDESAPDTPLTTWSDPACALTVLYPLALVYEIEFVVSEGYRRISHGGIEHGGILYGRVQDNCLRIQAFRTIECEHAFGPSFVLSASDIQKLTAQLHSASTDPELRGLAVLGWFISHSRSGLDVTDREWEWFDSLFPEPWQMLLLIKPEKFKPTRFAFAFRKEGQGRQSDLSSNAFILPLPSAFDRTKRDRRRQHDGPNGAERRGQTLDETAVIQEEKLPPPGPVAAAVPTFVAPETAREEPTGPTSVPSVPRRPATLWVCCIVLCILVLASALRFYWNYGSPPVALHVARQGDRLLVSWAAEPGARSGELRIQGGGSMRTIELSDAQMRTGRAMIGASGSDLKIELIVHRWLHDKRGLLRVLLPESPTK